MNEFKDHSVPTNEVKITPKMISALNEFKAHCPRASVIMQRCIGYGDKDGFDTYFRAQLELYGRGEPIEKYEHLIADIIGPERPTLFFKKNTDTKRASTSKRVNIGKKQTCIICGQKYSKTDSILKYGPEPHKNKL